MDTLTIHVDVSQVQGGARALANFGRQIERTERSVNSLGRTFRSVGRAYASFLSIQGAIQTIKDTVRAFASFETGLVAVGKTSDLSGKHLEVFGRKIQDMSKRIPVGTKELLAIAKAAGQAGVEGSKNILLFTETLAKLGATTDIQGERAAEAIAQFLNVVKEGHGEVGRLGSQLVALGNSSSLGEAQILKLAGEVGRATVGLNLGSGAIMAFAATMGEMRIQAELGGSVVGKAFGNIAVAVKDQGAQLKTLSKIVGMSGEDVTKAFGEDKVELFRKFLEGLKRISKGENGFASMITALEEFGLKGDEVRKTLPAFANNVDRLAEKLRLVKKEAAEPSALDKEFAAGLKTLSNAAKLAMNSLTVFGQRLVLIYVPLMKDVLKVTRTVTDGIVDAWDKIRIYGYGKSIDMLKERIKDLRKEASKLLGSGTTLETFQVIPGFETFFEPLVKLREQLNKTKAAIKSHEEQILKLNNATAENAQASKDAEDALNDLAGASEHTGELEEFLSDLKKKQLDSQLLLNSGLREELEQLTHTEQQLRDLGIARAEDALLQAQQGKAGKLYIDSLKTQVSLLKQIDAAKRTKNDFYEPATYTTHYLARTQHNERNKRGPGLGAGSGTGAIGSLLAQIFSKAQSQDPAEVQARIQERSQRILDENVQLIDAASDALKESASAMESIAVIEESRADTLADALEDAMAVVKNALSELIAMVNKEIQRVALIEDEAIALLKGIGSTTQNTLSALNSTLDALRRASVGPVTESSFGAAKDLLQSTLDLARGGGDISKVEGLTSALTTLGDIDSNRFSSATALGRERGRINSLIGDLIVETEGQISIQEQTLNAIDEAAAAIQGAASDQTASFQALINLAQQQVDGIMGVTSSVDASSANQLQGLQGITTSIDTNSIDQIASIRNAAISQIEGTDDVESAVNDSTLSELVSSSGLNASVIGVQSAINKLGAAIDAAAAADAAAANAASLAAAQEANKIAAENYNKILAATTAAQDALSGTTTNITGEKASLTALEATLGKALADGVDAYTKDISVNATGLTWDQAFAKLNSLVEQAENAYNTRIADLEAQIATKTALISASEALTPDIINTAANAASSTSAAQAALFASRQAVVDLGGTPSFAVGTNVVPFDMNANIHKGERIIPAADNRSLMNTSNDTANEVKGMRSDMKAILSAIATSNHKIYKIQERQDLQGLPPERVPA